MKTFLAISFRSALTLDELAACVGLEPVEFDFENEYEWAIGTLGDYNDIDIARSHLVPPAETRTLVCRYAEEPDRGIPVELIRRIHAALRGVATEFEVHGSEGGEHFQLTGEQVERL